ncbi:MAG: NUDIX domain-containing protein [Patescibacteria group bacterium]|jgi:8-oxo-dGTP diphosphatase
MEREHLGVCVIVLDATKTKVLLGKRKNSYRSGTFGLPGGRLELKESLQDCGTRELIEETGLRSKTLRYVGVVRELQEKFNFIHFVFLCDSYEGSPSLTEPEKCEGWEWFLLENLPENILPGHKAALDFLINKNKKTIRDLI